VEVEMVTTAPVTRAASICPVDLKWRSPKMPRFAGDVRDYAIFCFNFKHAVDTRLSKRDVILLLHTSLKDGR